MLRKEPVRICLQKLPLNVVSTILKDIAETFPLLHGQNEFIMRSLHDDSTTRLMGMLIFVVKWARTS